MEGLACLKRPSQLLPPRNVLVGRGKKGKHTGRLLRLSPIPMPPPGPALP